MSIVGREDNADNIAPKSISLGRSREMDCPRMARIGTEAWEMYLTTMATTLRGNRTRSDRSTDREIRMFLPRYKGDNEAPRAEHEKSK